MILTANCLLSPLSPVLLSAPLTLQGVSPWQCTASNIHCPSTSHVAIYSQVRFLKKFLCQKNLFQIPQADAQKGLKTGISFVILGGILMTWTMHSSQVIIFSLPPTYSKNPSLSLVHILSVFPLCLYTLNILLFLL